MNFSRLLCLVVVFTAAAASAIAPPKKIAFQGKLIDPATNLPRNGVVSMSFNIYDVATGGSPLYSENQNVTVVNGVFGVQIGDAGDLSADLFQRTTTYLGVTVTPDSEMTPRHPFSMSPYAFIAAGLMRSKNVVINSGASYSTFTVDGNLLIENGVNAGTATLSGYLDFSAAAAPAVAPAGSARLYYDSTGDSYLTSVNGRAFTPLGHSGLTLWNTNATAGVANQGLNLPAALTEFNSAVQGTRMTIDCDDLPAQLALRYNIRGITATALTLTVSARDTSNTANVLATVSQAVSGANVTYTGQGAYAAKPGWCTGSQQIALYTSGGNGAADYIFIHVVLTGKP